MSKGVVAAGHSLTAESAAEILRAGGNAFDAVIAGFFTACVAEPVLASLGGGGFALGRAGTKTPFLLDFFVETPLSKRPESELDFEKVSVDFGSTTQEFHIGRGAIAVPGATRGLFKLHRSHGRMPMSDLVAQAATLARQGAPVSTLQSHIFNVVEPIYVSRSSARRLFESTSTSGRVLREGEALRMERFADLVEVMAREGDDLFYRGEIAQAIERDCQEGGGQIRGEDLSRYDAIYRQPLSFELGDARVSLNPPPSTGGCLIAFALSILKDRGLSGLGPESPETLELLALAMEATNLARLNTTPDGHQDWPELDQLLSSDLVSAFRRSLNERLLSVRGTTHLNVIDSQGNVVAMTVSNGEGCGTLVPGTDLMLNNMLGEEDLNPGGFHTWAPGQRISSMMAPTLVEFADGGVMATGSGGSNRIRTAILQVLINVLEHQMDLESATAAPRIHVEDDALFLEQGFKEPAVNAVVRRFPKHTQFPGQSFFFGGVHSVWRKANSFEGTGDVRRGGVVRIVSG